MEDQPRPICKVHYLNKNKKPEESDLLKLEHLIQDFDNLNNSILNDSVSSDISISSNSTVASVPEF